MRLAEMTNHQVDATAAEILSRITSKRPGKFELKIALAREFGRRNGWKLSDRCFVWGQLARGSNQKTRQEERGGLLLAHEAADHRYFYRKDGRPAALAAHLYGWPTNRMIGSVAEVCAKHNLTARVATDFPSWHYPDVTTLIVYEPRTRL